MRTIVIGPAGKMGKLIARIVHERENMSLVGAVGPRGREYIGRDVGEVASIGERTGAVVVDDIENIIDECDVIVDYTAAECSMEMMEIALRHGKSFVCGTTGFSKEQMGRIEEISKQIPLVYAANTSRVVNLMYKLLEITAKAIGDVADIEIVDMHDKNKKDAPSGTAKEMGEVIAKALSQDISDIASYGRTSERESGSIGYHSLRAGDISSSHTVMFGLMGERLEITHHAHNWECFAQGACESAMYLKGKQAGLYTVKDVLGI
ncbi:MAG: 4-hydroxy-tetrahydrodipicolinate reductase [Tissierellales bacterium]|nr:4-hydroxy-tetrahydrodipicolinate reductase [Tissierellales bacterium]